MRSLITSDVMTMELLVRLNAGMTALTTAPMATPAATVSRMVAMPFSMAAPPYTPLGGWPVAEGPAGPPGGAVVWPLRVPSCSAAPSQDCQFVALRLLENDLQLAQGDQRVIDGDGGVVLAAAGQLDDLEQRFLRLRRKNACEAGQVEDHV